MKDVRYIYRMEPLPSRNEIASGISFVAFAQFSAGLARLGLLRRELGWSGALKGLLKLATGRRALFGLLQHGHFVSHVWSTKNSPRYPIEADACVLGPLLTQAEMRRRGLATALLGVAAGRLEGLGYRAIYIDTTPSNIESRRAITRAGFAPYAVLRGARLRKVPRGLSRGSGVPAESH
jgi:GNAT superfamily N-acetyltransferase